MNGKFAVVGAGTMGSGIAQIGAVAGHEVVVIDRDESALDRGRTMLAASLGASVRRSRMTEGDANAVASRIVWSSDLADARDCGLVVEAIVERLDIKRSVFAELARLVDRDTVLASNTSSLSIAAIANGLSYPERVVGLHFFNPVPAMKLVEIVAGEASDPTLIGTLSDLMRRWGKHPVVARDVPGFIVNRVARPFYAEAFVALEEDIEARVIDAALSGAGGFRMGPLALADMIGHDVNYAAAVSVYEGMTPDTRFRPQPAQARLVEQGRLGSKAGWGIYDHRTDQAKGPALPIALADGNAAGPAQSLLLRMLGRLAGMRHADIAGQPVVIDGVVVASGDGRCLSMRPDVDILFDHVRDPGSSPVLVATVRDDAAAAVASRLADSLGKDLLLVPDRPGQLVLRTLAQLANGAADAVRDGVASRTAIDEAMVHGANYPQGPLSWAHDYGSDAVKRTLAHIAEQTQDDLYVPSNGLDLL